MMPYLGSQLHCTLYTFIVLGIVIYSMVLFSIVLSFFCVLIFYCFNKRISVSPESRIVYDFSSRRVEKYFTSKCSEFPKLAISGGYKCSTPRETYFLLPVHSRDNIAFHTLKYFKGGSPQFTTLAFGSATIC